MYAAANKSKPIAIIVPAEPALKRVAQENGIKGDHLEELVNDRKLNGIVLQQLQTVGRKSGLAGFEIIEGVVLADEEWTPQNVSIKPPDPTQPCVRLQVKDCKFDLFGGELVANANSVYRAS